MVSCRASVTVFLSPISPLHAQAARMSTMAVLNGSCRISIRIGFLLLVAEQFY
jgi:hypothetical protein